MVGAGVTSSSGVAGADGGAAASAAELASSYAPELHVVGTYAGAPVADVRLVAAGAIPRTTSGKLARWVCAGRGRGGAV